MAIGAFNDLSFSRDLLFWFAAFFVKVVVSTSSIIDPQRHRCLSVDTLLRRNQLPSANSFTLTQSAPLFNAIFRNPKGEAYPVDDTVCDAPCRRDGLWLASLASSSLKNRQRSLRRRAA